MLTKLLCAAALLTATSISTNAATLNLRQAIEGGGDIADDSAEQDVTMPTFDSTLGTLTGVQVRLNIQLDWGEPVLITPEVAGARISLPASLSTILFSGSGAGGEFDARPAVWTADIGNSYFGVEITRHIVGAFADDPATYLDPAHPQVITVEPEGALDFFAGCSCGWMLFEDDFGDFDGSLTTRFTYTPTAGNSVPEPGSGLPLLAGFGALAIVSRRVRK